VLGFWPRLKDFWPFGHGQTGNGQARLNGHCLYDVISRFINSEDAAGFK